jgi:methionine-rich copper-binding protein CopC
MCINRLIARLVSVVALSGIAVFVGYAPAGAHDIPVATVPADNSAMSTGPKTVSVTFDKPVQDGFAELTVLGPGGTRWTAGPPHVMGDTISAALGPLGPAGRYTVEYRIVSADGHPVSGSFGFSLTVSGSGHPEPATVTTQSAASPPAHGSFPTWPWIVAGGALLAAALLTARRLADRT